MWAPFFIKVNYFTTLIYCLIFGGNYTICVVATNQNDTKQNGREGDKVDFAAPSNYYTTDINGYYSGFNGTSSGAPLVAGTIALILSKNNSLTVEGIKETLIESSEKVGGVNYDVNGHSNVLGYGRINAYQALNTTLNITFSNDVESENNIGHLLVNNNPTPRASGWSDHFMIGELVSVQPLEESYETSQGEDTKFYQWNYTDQSKNPRNFINDFYTNKDEDIINAKFKKTKTLTIRNYFEGGDGNTIEFGEVDYDVSTRNSPLLENAFIYQDQQVEVTYKATATSSYTNHLNTNWTFINWENGSTNLTREEQISQSSAPEWKAMYKGISRTDNSTAYSNSSQRKIIKVPYTTNLIATYESMGKIWLETSADNGNTWSLLNNSQPISGNYEAKNPSLSVVGDCRFALVYQENYNSYSRIIMKIMDICPQFNIEYSGVIHTDYDNYSTDANPVISVEYNSSNHNYYYLIAWDENPGSFNSPGIRYQIVKENTNSNFSHIFTTSQILTYTNMNSLNPTLTSSLTSKNPCEFHLAWQQYYSSSTQKIKYYKISVNSNDNVSFSNYSVPSDGRYSLNYIPSIAITLNRPRLGWITYNPENMVGEAVVRTNNGTSAWGIMKVYAYSNGNEVESINLNNRDVDYGFIMAYGGDGREVRYTKGFTSTYAASPTRHNNDVQVSNGLAFTDMYISSLKTSSVPYSFETNQVDNTVGKKNSKVVSIGRSANVYLEDILFQCTIKDVVVDDEIIEFMELEDDKQIEDVETTNNYLYTEEFKVKKKSDFTFKLEYGNTENEKVKELLTGKNYVKFIVELMDEKTNAVIAKLDEIVYDAEDPFQTDRKLYQVNMENIGTEKVKIKLRVEENIKGNTAIADITADKRELPKQGFTILELTADNLVNNYALMQNYPNPFNPQTTISYQLPKDGYVTLKVFDALGKEITTLVNGYKQSGKYNVVFDGSNLASGVYFYKITAGKFTDTKKFILMK